MQEDTSNGMSNETNEDITNQTSNESVGEAKNEEAAIGEITINEATSQINDGQATPPINPLPKPKKQKILIIGALLLIGLLLAQLGQIIAANMNPKTYLLKVLNNTDRNIKSELAAMQKNNPVLKRYAEISAGASQHRLALDSAYLTGSMGLDGLPAFNLDFIMTNDPEKKQFQFGTDFPLIGGAYFYLSDQEAVINFLAENYTLGAKTAGEEIRMFLDNNAIPYDESSIPKDLDLSYSAVSMIYTDYSADGILPTHARIWNQYYAKLMELYNSATLKKTNGTTQVGGDEVKCTVMVLTLAEHDIREWLNGLYSMAKEDAELAELLGESYEGTLNDLEYAADYSSGDITADIFIYKDHVIETYINTNESRIGLAARGKNCRLDHIEFSALSKADEVESSFTMKGNHIGGGIFSSEIINSEGTTLVNWDPAGSTDNVSVQTAYGENIVFTFALDEDGVVLKPFSGTDSENLILRAYPVQSGSINWPLRTTPLTDLNLQELAAKIIPFG